ncbi:helix-turn-helix domain-containing protein [Chitinophaga arvensicola]|uniref:Methylphosphotriester-DNA--protein-cysteine methyltransferase (N-terminal of Ada), contains Zn-binding and two AraC-type DNA-binding domains n=1 Tax=Chitinophaga arvensicola TaxID=29529 RepID=A0A1I0S5I9_9BACT|nr:helix-turn-helix domain-containing protein [Chitinophaga arvensicola]SEW50129.1 Methylphosphotriester-DNA--protein-cysteine methyltransferase (N-terminal fragment of Ada), contains Zn-binding and two AraC-type DNA-binding domains [Chitinophaga arvensicola]
MLSYREYPVAPVLSAYIKKFWVLDNSQESTPAGDKSILPNGCTNLAFIYGQGIGIRSRQTDIFLKAGIYLVGQLSTSIRVSIAPFTKITLTQFYPWTPGLLMPGSLADTAGGFIPLGDVDQRLYRLLEPFSPDDEAGIMAFFCRSLTGLIIHPGRQEVLQAACNTLRTRRGGMAIRDLADELGCSTRHLEKEFRRGLGITPKDYAGIIRVRSLVDAMVHQPLDGPVSQLAMAYGFYDQAHFIKTFGAITHTSPGKFQAADFLLQNGGEGF